MMNRLWRRYVGLTEAFCFCGIAVVAILGGLQVWFRYVLDSSLVWSEELMRLTMIWVVMLGSGLAYSRGQFLGMRFLVNAMPKPVARIMDILSALLMLSFLAVLVWYGWAFADRTRLQLSPTLGFSLVWVNVSVVVGALILALHIIRDDLLGWREMPVMEDEA